MKTNQTKSPKKLIYLLYSFLLSILQVNIRKKNLYTYYIHRDIYIRDSQQK